MKKIQPLTLFSLLIIPMGFLYIFFNNAPLQSKAEFITFFAVIVVIANGVMVLSKSKLNFKWLFGLTILSRLLFLFIPPNLSPDFYRFIWDGELLNMGINPYAYTPNELISMPSIYASEYMRLLYHGMTDLSQVHYSNYPIVNQLFYFIPAYFFDSIQGNILGLKLIIILFDIGSILLIKKLLILLKINENKLWLYALNPLIIIEFAGNLHFEGVMIFFLLLSIYFVVNPKYKSSGWIMAGIFLALSAQIKLIPLMFIPFYYKKMRWRKSLGFTAVTLIIFILIGMILWSQPMYFNNMMKSINDYFVSFEFNSSIFTIFNHIKSSKIGWNATYIIGPLLSKIAFVLIIVLAVFRKYTSDVDIFKGMMFALLIYYGLATTVHPWYISMVLVLGIFTNYQVGFIWSIMVINSYIIYLDPNQTNSVKILEYLIVSIILIRDIIVNRKNKAFGLNFKEFFSE
jgi:hypothetical protein